MMFVPGVFTGVTLSQGWKQAFLLFNVAALLAVWCGNIDTTL